MRALHDLQFLFVVGKGGVGKTTTSAAIALAAARQGKRVLIAMCNAKERLSYLLEVAPIGTENRTILPGIDAVNMTPQTAIEEYGRMVLKVRALYKAVFENRFVTAFLHGTPGLDAWSMLGKAYFHAIEEDEKGRRYDLVIVDAPGTGHALDMLRVPRVIVDVAPPGLLRREAERAIGLFRDPSRAGVVLVTLAEDMPANETIELHAAIVGELALPVAKLVVNGVLPRLFADDERERIVDLGQRGPEVLSGLARASFLRSSRERVQQGALTRLAQLELPRVDLPRLFVPEFRRAAIESLSQAFAGV